MGKIKGGKITPLPESAVITSALKRDANCWGFLDGGRKMLGLFLGGLWAYFGLFFINSLPTASTAATNGGYFAPVFFLIKRLWTSYL